MAAIAQRDRDVMSPTPRVEEPAKRGRLAVFVLALRRGVPTALVVAALGGIAYWGHSSDWTLPKFSTLLNGYDVATVSPISGTGGWCKEHNVPSAECIECNSAILKPDHDFGWCPEHGIAQCPLHHPEVAQLKSPPTVTPTEIDRVKFALSLLPRGENSSGCKHYLKRIQFASTEAMEKAGVDIAVVRQSPITEAITANGEVIYDQTRSAHLASRVAGTVWSVEKQVGDPVQKGDVLVLVDSAEIGRAKSEFLQSMADVRLKETNVERMRPLARDGTVPGRQFRESEASLEEARIRLRSAQQSLVNLGLPVRADDYSQMTTDRIADEIQFLGLPAELVEKMRGDAVTSNLFPLRAPLNGTVVECNVVSGEVVDATETIYGVSDVGRMWLQLDVRQEDIGHVSLGQTVRFRSSNGKSEPEFTGSIAWISTESDDKTRTVKVRVELPNADRRLRANTFGTGRIVLRDESQAMIVPTEAVHSDGDCSIVFVRDKNFLHQGSPKFFHIREVRVGVRDGANTEVITGLLPGEVIASKNSMVLEAQLLKSNLGAGCACCAPVKK